MIHFMKSKKFTEHLILNEDIISILKQAAIRRFQNKSNKQSELYFSLLKSRLQNCEEWNRQSAEKQSQNSKEISIKIKIWENS